jgi:cyclophilin family peptidyl-prolyl cis-trans isomerase
MTMSPLRAALIAALTVTVVARVAGQRPRAPLPPVPPAQPQPLPTALAANLQSDADLVSIAADRLLADRAYPPGEGQIGALVGPSDDLRTLMLAAVSSSPIVRIALVRALGRFERSADLPQIAQFLNDLSPAVRAASATAIAQSLWKERKKEIVSQARDAIEVRLKFELDETAAGAMLAALGNLHYETDVVHDVEQLLGAHIMPVATLQLLAQGTDGALRGLEALTRVFPNQPLDPAVLRRLRAFATDDNIIRLLPNDVGLIRLQDNLTAPQLQAKLTALQTLQNARDDDIRTIQTAATYHCSVATPRGPFSVSSLRPSCGWQIRLTGVQMMNRSYSRLGTGGSLEFDQALDRARHDDAFQVRYEALTRLARDVEKTGTCQPLIEALDDRVTQVVIHAVELLSPKCEEHDDLTDRLTQWAMLLGDPRSEHEWQVPVAALKSLFNFAPEAAAKIVKATAATHAVWQVRVAAVQIASLAGDEETVLRLAADVSPRSDDDYVNNVRTEALNALLRLQSPAIVDAALRVLKPADSEPLLIRPDNQLLFTAANVLKGHTEAHAEAVPALVEALHHLSGDSSRDTRMAILARLQELGSTEDNLPIALKPLLEDVDPVVAGGAADVIATFAGTRPVPKPTRRPPLEPSTQDIQEVRSLRTLLPQPNFVRIFLDTGDELDVRLDPDVAPIAASKFYVLAKGHAYDGLPFSRVIANNFAQGGGMNDYTGTEAYWRDEIGLSHSYGAVGLATHGHDTGVGQFFIDLNHLPNLDHDYAIFGALVEDAPGYRSSKAIEHLVEGVKIRTICIGPLSDPPCMVR